MNKKVIIVVSIIMSIIVICITGFYFLISNALKVDKTNMEILVFEDYELPKYQAKIFNKDIKVKVNDGVNRDKIGNYKITYEVNFLFKNKKVVNVKVVDKEKPVIELIGEEEVNNCPNKLYLEEGYKAIDNYDGDLTDNINITKEDNKIVYSVKDSSGNESVKERIINYKDETKPIIKLNGGSTITYNLGGNYKENGYSATDNCNGILTNKVKVEGRVNTKKAGTYKIKYTVSDDSNNITSVTRTIVVKNTKAASGNNNKGVIYLTFDDGPHARYTKKILDVLKKYNIKATFFVTCSGPDSLIVREHKEGHTVALHTASHNYKTIYSSIDGYFKDLNKVSDRVYRLTGVKSKIIRFPGGSSNTVSKNYSRGIMSALSVEVVERGYNYFDWNISSGDAGSTTSAKGVFNNVKNGLSKARGNVVLMHDIKSYTANAIEDIIQYGLKNGYEFRKLTYETKPTRHGINN